MARVLRILPALCSACLATLLVSYVANFASSLFPCASYGVNCIEFLQRKATISRFLEWTTFVGWLLVWLGTEVRLSLTQKTHTRALTHLCYGPLAVSFLFLTIVLSYDNLMIQHSRWKVRQYIHSGSAPTLRPELYLHNDYRGWCGNGFSQRLGELYDDIAVEEFKNPDPQVRAHALQASLAIFDLELLAKAHRDEDPVVRKIAADFETTNLRTWP